MGLKRFWGSAVHEITKDMEILQQAIVRYSVERMRMDPPEIDAPMTPEQLTAMAGQTITDKGLGGLEALGYLPMSSHLHAFQQTIQNS